MTHLEQYKKGKIDLAPFGLERRAERGGYFCDPIGARAIAWTGVEGIHYSVIRDFGEMIFVIDPSALPGEYVHPVAKDFTDFLRLLLVCGSEAAISQAYMMDADRFLDYLRENAPDEATCESIAALAKKTALTPMENPHAYIRELQADFPYRSIRFGRDYAEWAPAEPSVLAAPEWKVYYNGSFFSHTGRARPGKEISLHRHFRWGEREFYIPAIYVCTDGIVLDFCSMADMDSMWTHLKKLADFEQNGDTRIPMAEDLLAQENPLYLDARACLDVNGETIRAESGYALTYIPEVLGAQPPDREAKWVIQHYGLDASECWAVHRYAFPWRTRRSIHSISLSLSQCPLDFPAGEFVTPGMDSITLTHPLTKKEYTIRIVEETSGEIGRTPVDFDGRELPTKYVQIRYTVDPPLGTQSIVLRDCAQSDEPRLGKPDSTDANASTIGIIGGADGPTAVFFSSSGEETPRNLRAANSSLHFALPESVRWKVIFRERLLPDVSIPICAETDKM